MTLTFIQLVAAKVRAEMAFQKRQVTELAVLLEMGADSASRKFNGHVALTLTDLDRISKWLNCPVEQFIGDRDAA